MPFDGLFIPQALQDAVADQAWLRAMLDAESALARAEARVGVLSSDAADAVASASAQAFDVAALVEEGRRVGNPVEPLVRALRKSAPQAHWGATSQDILDTAAALVARDAISLIADDLGAAADACAALAERHRATVMAGRTLLQQAVPTTFGLKAAGWLLGLKRVRELLLGARLPAQLGGAAGTLAAFGDRGVDAAREFARELQLEEPALSWHTRRLPVAELGAALGIAAGFLGKIALDIVLLAQSEVAEVREAAAGASSTMPHKRNPVDSTLARACAIRAQAAAGVLVSALVQEHERAAGAWHAEWGALSDALALTGGAAAAVRRALSGLEVDAERMRANIHADTLSEASRFGIDAKVPEDYLGSADALIDRALSRDEDR